MDSEQLISHPELQSLMKKFKKKFPLIPLEAYMYDLGRVGFSGMGLNVDEVKDILEKCPPSTKKADSKCMCPVGFSPVLHNAVIGSARVVVIAIAAAGSAVTFLSAGSACNNM